MAYTSSIKIYQTNTTSFVFEDLNFLDSIPSSITSLTLRVVNADEAIDETLDLESLGMSVASQKATIPNTSLGLDDDVNIVDGVYTLTYTYSFTNSEGAQSGNISQDWAIVGNLEKFLAQQFAVINDLYYLSPVKSTLVIELLAAEAMLYGLKFCGNNGMSDQYGEIMDTLERMSLFEDYTF